MRDSQVTITIDTYSFVHNLMASGFSEPQAKTVLDEIRKIHLHNVASKDDIETLRTEVKGLDGKIDKLDHKIERVESKIDVTAARQDARIEAASSAIIRWVVPLILGIYGLVIFRMFH